MRLKKISGYPGYRVSNTGRVFSDKHGDRKELSPTADRGDYVYVTLFKNQQSKKKYLHILVANAFLKDDKPLGKPEVNHKNGNKSNNRVGNLEWKSGSSNTQHAFDTGLATKPKGELNGKSKLTRKQVNKIKKSKSTLHKLADLYDMSAAGISYIKNGKRW